MCILWLEVADRPLVYVAGREVPGGDQVAEPLRGEGLDLVICGVHALEWY